MSEFDLINRYFKSATKQRNDVIQGIGDDCAIVSSQMSDSIISSMDTLVSGVHFFADTAPYQLGYKSLAVNISDIAAMGGTPLWVMLALTLPDAQTEWLSEFMRGFSDLAKKHHIQLIGGDTTKGPLSITVHIQGYGHPSGNKLLRSNAQVGDDIYVSGVLGDAALALQQINNKKQIIEPSLLEALQQPMPQLAIGQSIGAYAHSCIDVSDGLIADLQHITKASQVSATVYLDAIPKSQHMQAYIERTLDYSLLLSGGDDYQLCFTVDNGQNAIPASCTKIGKIVAEQESSINIEDSHGHALATTLKGYNHFENN